jgi:hypothetical protein
LSLPGVRVPGEPRWQAGVALEGYPTETPDLWDACSAGTARVKDEGTTRPTPSFQSFVLYVPIICSALGIGDPEELAGMAAAVLEATESWGVERALAQGIVGMSNPFLADSNLTVLATNVSAEVALAYLEDAIGQTGRRGMIHLTPAVASALQAIPVGIEGPEAPVFTASGTPVAIGGGYIGADPSFANPGQPSPGATSDWVFATGPVEVRIEDEVTLVPEEVSEALDRTTNDVVYRAEKVAVVSWDTALQVGVLVDWSL